MKKDGYLRLIDAHPSLFTNEDASLKIILATNEVEEWKEKTKIKLQHESLPDNWGDIGIVFDDPRVLILRDLVEFPGGFRNGYIRIYNRALLERGSAGVVVFPERNGKVLLMHNFRHATRQWHWEIPRGFGEPGVSAEDQAKAEAKEEIGVEPENIELVALGTLYNNTGLEGNPINLFFAHVTTSGILNQEIGTDELRWVSVREFEKMIADGEITDGFTIAAYTRAKLKGLI